MKRSCPFCNKEIGVERHSTPKEARVGIMYLIAKCLECNIQIDGAGVGELNALNELDLKIKNRIGTDPGQWKIRPTQRKKRKWQSGRSK